MLERADFIGQRAVHIRRGEECPIFLLQRGIEDKDVAGGRHQFPCWIPTQLPLRFVDVQGQPCLQHFGLGGMRQVVEAQKAAIDKPNVLVACLGGIVDAVAVAYPDLVVRGCLGRHGSHVEVRG